MNGAPAAIDFFYREFYVFKQKLLNESALNLFIKDV